MASCAYCNSFILFGGVTDGDLRFCNAGCHEKGLLAHVASRLPARDVKALLAEVHQGRCPKCEGKGPIDVHVNHTVWSAIRITSWKSTPNVCCKSCGRKAQIGGIAFSFFLGWWGFPFGIVMTPVQICRNIGGIFGGPNPDEPSAELENIVRLGMAAGDFGPVSTRPRRVEQDDAEEDDLIDAFEPDDDEDDDDSYDEVEIVTKSAPQRRSSATRAKATHDDEDEPQPRAAASRSQSPATSSSVGQVVCPQCESKFKVSASIRGKRVRCPQCSGVIEVPE